MKWYHSIDKNFVDSEPVQIFRIFFGVVMAEDYSRLITQGTRPLLYAPKVWKKKQKNIWSNGVSKWSFLSKIGLNVNKMSIKVSIKYVHKMK